MTSAQLEAIRTRMKNASDGPWSVRRIPNTFASQAGDRFSHPCVRGFRVPRRIYDLAWQQVEADAEFIAHARNDIPALLEEIEHLRSTLLECQTALAELLQRDEPVSPRDVARIEQFIADEDTRWGDEPEKLVRARRLYMSVPTIRPREAVTPIGVRRRSAKDTEAR